MRKRRSGTACRCRSNSYGSLRAIRATPPWIKPWEDGPRAPSEHPWQCHTATISSSPLLWHRYRYNDSWLTHERSPNARSTRSRRRTYGLSWVFSTNESSQTFAIESFRSASTSDQTIGCVTPPLKFGNEPVAIRLPPQKTSFASTPICHRCGTMAAKPCISLSKDWKCHRKRRRFISSEDYYATIFTQIQYGA